MFGGTLVAPTPRLFGGCGNVPPRATDLCRYQCSTPPWHAAGVTATAFRSNSSVTQGGLRASARARVGRPRVFRSKTLSLQKLRQMRREPSMPQLPDEQGVTTCGDTNDPHPLAHRPSRC